MDTPPSYTVAIMVARARLGVPTVYSCHGAMRLAFRSACTVSDLLLATAQACQGTALVQLQRLPAILAEHIPQVGSEPRRVPVIEPSARLLAPVDDNQVFLAIFRDAETVSAPLDARFTVHWKEPDTCDDNRVMRASRTEVHLTVDAPRLISSSGLAAAVAAHLGLDGQYRYALTTDDQMLSSVAMAHRVLVDADTPNSSVLADTYAVRHGVTLHLVRARLPPSREPVRVEHVRALPGSTEPLHTVQFDPETLWCTHVVITQTKTQTKTQTRRRAYEPPKIRLRLRAPDRSVTVGDAVAPPLRPRVRTPEENAARELLKCGVCWEVTPQPCVPECGHIVCWQCHTRIRATRSAYPPEYQFVCPQCRCRPMSCDGATTVAFKDPRLRVFYQMAELLAASAPPPTPPSARGIDMRA